MSELDHPDFLPIPRWVFNINETHTDEVLAGNAVLDLPLGNYAAEHRCLGIYYETIGGAMDCEVLWENSNFPGIVLGRQTATFLADSEGVWIVPVLQKEIDRLRVTADAGGITESLIPFFTDHLPGGFPIAPGGTDGVLVNRISDPIAATAQETIDLPFYAGEATIHLASGSSMRIIIGSYDRNGVAVGRPFRVDMVGVAVGMHTLRLPPRWNQLIITETGGVASAYTVSIIADLHK